MIRRAIAVLFVIGMIPTAAATAAANGVLLRLNLPVGPTPGVQFVLDQQIQQTVQGRVIHLHQMVSMGMAATVTSRDAAGNMDVRFTFESMKMQVEGPGVAAAKPMLDRIARAIVGKSYRAVLTPRGRVASLSGLDQVMTAMVGAMRLPPGPQKTAMESTFKQQFGESAMKEDLARMLPTYPDKPVHVGDRWVVDQSITRPYPLAVRTRYHLVSASGNEARLAISSTLGITNGRMSAGGTGTTLTLNGTQTGTQVLSRRTGWVGSGDVRQNIAGTITVTQPGKPGTRKSLTIPMVIRTTVRIGSLPASAR